MFLPRIRTKIISIITLFSAKPIWKITKRLVHLWIPNIILRGRKSVRTFRTIYKWIKQQQCLSWKEKLRYELECIIQRSDIFDDFLEKCRLNGIEAVYKPKNTVSLKFRMQGQQRFARAKTLGYYYLPKNIQRRIRQFSSHRKMILDRSKFDNRGLQYWNVHSTLELKPTTMTVMARRGMMLLDKHNRKVNNTEEIQLN